MKMSRLEVARKHLFDQFRAAARKNAARLIAESSLISGIITSLEHLRILETNGSTIGVSHRNLREIGLATSCHKDNLRYCHGAVLYIYITPTGNHFLCSLIAMLHPADEHCTLAGIIMEGLSEHPAKQPSVNKSLLCLSDTFGLHSVVRASNSLRREIMIMVRGEMLREYNRQRRRYGKAGDQKGTDSTVHARYERVSSRVPAVRPISIEVLGGGLVDNPRFIRT